MATYPVPEKEPHVLVIPRTASYFISWLIAYKLNGMMEGIKSNLIDFSAVVNSEIGMHIFENFLPKALHRKLCSWSSSGSSRSWSWKPSGGIWSSKKGCLCKEACNYSMIPEVAINLRAVCACKCMNFKIYFFETLPSNFILLMPRDHQSPV